MSQSILLIITTLFCVHLKLGHFANILGFFVAPICSHHITFEPIISELAQRGHNLTVITPNPIDDPSLKTLTEIDVQKISYKLWNRYNISSFGLNEEVDSTSSALFITAFMEIVDAQLSHPKVQDIIQNPGKYHFDMFLVEFPVYLGIFKRLYNTSMVGIISMPIHLAGDQYIGNPTHPVLFPDLNLPYSNKLTFWQKIHSFLHSIVVSCIWERYVSFFNEILAKHFGWDIINQNKDIYKEFDLLLVNYNPILYGPRPNVPAVVEFNGIHIKPEMDLPWDIKNFLDSATEGAVYISFGTNIKSTKLPIVKQQMIIGAISELHYKFLWKFESNTTEMPKNVHITEWAPQQDVLRHKNIKLFVTQGGIQSLDEAMYTKTPVLVIPFFGDQLGNAEKAQQAGLGKSLNFKSLTKEAFKNAIVEIINDQAYKLRMEEVHDILTDQPMSAVDKTVWWIEYVLRHKGAQHMRCSTLNATVIDYYMIDVIGFLVGCLLFVLWVIYVTVKLLVKSGKRFLDIWCSRRGDKDKERKLKKN